MTKLTKPVSSNHHISYLRSTLVQYKDYIKNFEWNYRKYNIKLPLNELCSAFTKVSLLTIANFLDPPNARCPPQEAPGRAQLSQDQALSPPEERRWKLDHPRLY